MRGNGAATCGAYTDAGKLAAAVHAHCGVFAGAVAAAYPAATLCSCLEDRRDACVVFPVLPGLAVGLDTDMKEHDSICSGLEVGLEGGWKLGLAGDAG